MATRRVLKVSDQKDIFLRPMNARPSSTMYAIRAIEPSPSPSTIMDCARRAPTGSAAFSTSIPCEVISQAYGKEFGAGKGIYYGNFYKCADKSQTPHFGSFSPMGSLPPGFHCPELFAKIIVEEE